MTRSNTNAVKTLLDWVAECKYISDTTDKHGDVREFNHDPACFIRYCKMQRDGATREGHHDAATYIQECIDDMEHSA